MRKEYYKLVRDLIPEIIQAQDLKFSTRTLSDTEFKVELLKKIGEESAEALLALEKGDDETLVNELADIFEALEKIPQAFAISPDKIRQAMDKKRKERGSFNNKVFLESVDE